MGAYTKTAIIIFLLRVDSKYLPEFWDYVVGMKIYLKYAHDCYYANINTGKT